MSYHGIYITTKDMARTSLFDMPYGYELTISRVCGCVLYHHYPETRVVASEFPLTPDAGLKVEYGREVLCDSLPHLLPHQQEPARIYRHGPPAPVVRVTFTPGMGKSIEALVCDERRHVETAVAALEG